MTEFEITPSDDAETMSRLHAVAMEDAWSATSFRHTLNSPGVFAFLAGHSSAAMGFILARCVAVEAEILMIAVPPANRRSGIGRALVRAALARAEKSGAKAVFLEVAVSNEAAQALYFGAGFQLASRRRDYYQRQDGSSEDALLLRYDVPEVLGISPVSS